MKRLYWSGFVNIGYKGMIAWHQMGFRNIMAWAIGCHDMNTVHITDGLIDILGSGLLKQFLSVRNLFPFFFQTFNTVLLLDITLIFDRWAVVSNMNAIQSIYRCFQKQKKTTSTETLMDGDLVTPPMESFTMVTSWNGNIFHVTHHLWGEFPIRNVIHE